jgi:hypothetical protein
MGERKVFLLLLSLCNPPALKHHTAPRRRLAELLGGDHSEWRQRRYRKLLVAVALMGAAIPLGRAGADPSVGLTVALNCGGKR